MLGIVIGLFAVLGVVLLGSIVATAAFMPGCGSCHLEGAFGAATANGTHSNVACGACHGGSTVESKFSFGGAVVLEMVLPFGKVDPALAAVTSTRCRSCHAKDIKQPLEAVGLRIAHESCAVTRECSDCHSSVAHGKALSWPRSVTMDMCYDCHGIDALPSACDMCHTARLPKDRVNTGIFSVTHGSKNLQTHGLGRMNTCVQCHESSKCAKCHGVGVPHEGTFVTTHGPVAGSAAAQCTDCHTSRFCTDCHGYSVPHPTAFTKQHAKTVERDGQRGCKKCHAPQDCVQCHLDHVHPVTQEQLRALGVNPVGSGDQR